MAEYRYNSLGQRVAKLTDQGFTTYLYGPDGQLLGESEYDATGSRQRSQSYLWLDSLPLASVQAQGSAPAKVLYLHSDHLNTPRLATSAGQQIVWQWQSDAFGNGTANQDPQGSGLPTVLNLRFPGQYFDAESGLHYNYFRDYDPQTGRYVESDPIGLEGGLNTYGYVEGNPLVNDDEFGLSPRGERGATGGTSGRDSKNPYKHCKNHPTDPSKIVCKDHQTGRTVTKPKPDDWPKDVKSESYCPAGDECQKAAVVVMVGGAAYVAYRCVRMVPSLFPPLWPTIPINAVAP